MAERGRDDYIWCALLNWDILEKISIAVLTLSGPDFSNKGTILGKELHLKQTVTTIWSNHH